MVFEVYGSPPLGHTVSQLSPLRTLIPCIFLIYAIYGCPFVFFIMMCKILYVL